MDIKATPKKNQATSGDKKYANVVTPDSFEIEEHYYSRVLNAQQHPLVTSFMSLTNKVVAARYCHLHPSADQEELLKLLTEPRTYFLWSGADLFSVTDDQGKKQIIVIETNSCPSGNKSLPLPRDTVDNDSNYHMMLVRSFWPRVQDFKGGQGALAVLYDKNPMEVSGYAAAMADISGEEVFVAPWYSDTDDGECAVKIHDSQIFVRVSGQTETDYERKAKGSRKKGDRWIPIRAAFRYVTQKPWSRLPPSLKKTFVFNPVVCCLAGGRNKMCADKAYEFFNHKYFKHGLGIRTPVTIRDVCKREVPIWVKSMGGCAVVKNPYSNAGQGVYTICTKDDLEVFMAEEHSYEKFIVQSLVGNSGWSSDIKGKKYYHTGTIPDKQLRSYCSDLRMMVCSGKKGFRIVSMYARRAADPLTKTPPGSGESWGQLGTNLSFKTNEGKWDTNTRRLLLMDARDFNKLSLGLDDLIDGYVQTVCAVVAIDKMCIELMKGGSFDYNLYGSLNSDSALLEEVKQATEKNSPPESPSSSALSKKSVRFPATQDK